MKRQTKENRTYHELMEDERMEVESGEEDLRQKGDEVKMEIEGAKGQF